MTGKIVAKADRSQDPFGYIDDLRQEVYELGESRDAQDKRIKLLEDAERDRLTGTGVWLIVKEKLEAETVDWVKWGIRAAFCGLGSLMLTAMGWMIVRIFRTS